MAHDPALLCGWSGEGQTSYKNFSSVSYEPFLIASGMLLGKSGCNIMLL